MSKKVLSTYILIFISISLFSSPFSIAIRRGTSATVLEDSALLWESYELYEQALAEDPTNLEIYFNYANSMNFLYDYQEVKQVLDRTKVCELSKQDEAKLYYHYGYLGMLSSDPDYKKYFDKSLEIYDTLQLDVQLIFDKLLILKNLEKYKEAEDLYDLGVEEKLIPNFVNSKDVLTPFEQSTIVNNMNSTRNSFINSLNLYISPYYKSLQNINYESSDEGRSFHRVESKQSAWEKYVTSYRDSIKSYPTQISHYLKLANALAIKEDYETVKQSLLPALEENLSSIEKAQIYNSLGFLALFYNQPDHQEYLSKALQLYQQETGNKVSNRNIPFILKALDREDEAVLFVKELESKHDKLFYDNVRITLKYFDVETFRKSYSNLITNFNLEN